VGLEDFGGESSSSLSSGDEACASSFDKDDGPAGLVPVRGTTLLGEGEIIILSISSGEEVVGPFQLAVRSRV